MDWILIRHPAVALAPGICYGCSDIALADDGALFAARVAARLHDWPRPSVVYTSPLGRCVSVAAGLAAHYRCPLAADTRLREVDFGTWEMRPWSAIDPACFAAWEADLRHARPHGGESLAMLAERLMSWIEESCAHPSAQATRLIVTHAGVIRVLSAILLDLPIDACLSWALRMGAVCRLSWHARSAHWGVHTWNGQAVAGGAR